VTHARRRTRASGCHERKHTLWRDSRRCSYFPLRRSATRAPSEVKPETAPPFRSPICHTHYPHLAGTGQLLSVQNHTRISTPITNRRIVVTELELKWRHTGPGSSTIALSLTYTHQTEDLLQRSAGRCFLKERCWMEPEVWKQKIEASGITIDSVFEATRQLLVR
jgi:hypothetical protein